MSLGQHLVELRKRLFRAALAVVAGTIGGWFIYDLGVWSVLSEPITRIADSHGDDAAAVALNFTNITGAFEVHLQVAIVIGIVISSPVWLYQLFAFFVPGLTGKEKRYTFGFFFTAIPLFFVGCYAGWWVLPHIVEVMASFVPEGSTTLYTTQYYLDFVLKLVLATGIAFVLPVFLVLLNFVGIIQGKTILKAWRWAILIIAVFTAFATPAADVVSMFLLAIPMVFLYFVAVFIALWHDRIVARRAAAFEASLSGA